MRRFLLGLIGVSGLVAIALTPLAPVPTGAADTAVPSVTVNHTTQIVDGQAVTVTIRTTSDVPVYSAETRLCRAGVQYKSSTDNRPDPDFQIEGMNCPGPFHPVSTSSDMAMVDSNASSNAPTAEGDTFLFRLGTGVATWQERDTGAPMSLTCDPTHSCALVVEVQLQPPGKVPAEWKPFVFPISYGEIDPIVGCGGPALGSLSTGGSDRVFDAWVALTLDECGRRAEHGALSRASFIGEGEAVKSFGAGTLDLAYTAGGFNKDMGLLPPTAPKRAAVAIPIALNATTVAVAGGVITGAGHKAPYKDIKMTVPELAAMFAGGAHGVDQPAPDSPHSPPFTYEGDILERNPELSKTGLFDLSSGTIVDGHADAEAFNWYATRWFEQAAPGSWKVPNIPLYRADAGRSRVVSAALGTADPSFIFSADLVSGRPLLRKGLIGPSSATEGGIWVLTDLETASALGLTSVQVPDGHGGFVGPNAGSLVAALPSMKADEQGILLSDPKAAPQGAYPLTFVEYAMVPAEPLVNADCTPRTVSQKVLTDWLTYVTGPGQAKLPAGMVPLPQALRAQAAAAIQRVGTAPVTGSCAALASAGPGSAPAAADLSVPALPPAIPPGSSELPLGSLPSAPVFSDQPVLAKGPIASEPAASEPAPSQASAASDNKLAAIPAFAGRRASGWGSTVFALVGIMALTTLALFATRRGFGDEHARPA